MDLSRCVWIPSPDLRSSDVSQIYLSIDMDLACLPSAHLHSHPFRLHIRPITRRHTLQSSLMEWEVPLCVSRSFTICCRISNENLLTICSDNFFPFFCTIYSPFFTWTHYIAVASAFRHHLLSLFFPNTFRFILVAVAAADGGEKHFFFYFCICSFFRCLTHTSHPYTQTRSRLRVILINS